MFNLRKRRLETAEFAFLVECCRRAFGPGDTQVTPPANTPGLPADLDWATLLGLARRHRVQGLVWRSLHQARAALPPEVAAALATEAETIARNGMMEAAESARLLEAFSSAGVPVLFVKGLTLARLAYGDPFVKMAWDIDILVSIEQLPLAAAQLVRAGYEQVNPPVCGSGDRLRRWHASHKESLWRKAAGDIHIELHTRLADNPLLLADMTARSPQQLISVAPGVTLPTLADDELFAYLSVHGSGSAWHRLKWLADLAALLNQYDSRQIDHLYRRSREIGAAGAAGPALLLARDLFGIRLGAPLTRELEEVRAHRWLARLAWRQMMSPSEPTEGRLGTVPIHFVQFLLHPGARFKFGELRRQFADALDNRR